MRCIKTGFNLIRMSHMDVLRGDLFVHGNALIAVAHEHTSRPLDPAASKDKYTIIVSDDGVDGRVLSTDVYVIDVDSGPHMTQSMYHLIDSQIDLGDREDQMVLANMEI